MDEFLVDKSDIEQFVDELIKRKPLPAATAEELYSLRESSIKQLNEDINFAILGHFSPEQLKDIERTIDEGKDTPEYFQSLFFKNNINLDKIISETAETFGKKFLGANNG